MKAIVSIIFSFILLASCRPRPCEFIKTSNEKLPVNALESVPYENGQVIKLQHSNGYVILYDVLRETTEYEDDCRECCMQRTIEINTTRLIPDYPIFEIQININPMDSINYAFSINLGRSQFWMTSDSENSEYYQKNDSIVLNELVYYDVYKLKSGYGYGTADSIYADSLFYNFKFGILQIKMSNGENYTIHN